MWRRTLVTIPNRTSIFLHTKFNFTTGKINFKDKKDSSDKNEKEGDKKKEMKNILAKVKGLSEAVLEVPCDPVGPDASKDGKYKNPEYYCYHKYSFYEAFVELQKYRT